MEETDFYDHAHSKNPLIRYLVRGYFDMMDRMLKDIEVPSVLDIGCGSGYVTNHINELLKPQEILGVDISPERLELARARYPSLNVMRFDALNMPLKDSSASLVVATQILEHIENSANFVGVLKRISSRYVFLSVPNAFLWRLGNIVRGKYWRALGNPPGHIKDWNKKKLYELLSLFFNKVEIRRHYIWLLALCEK